MACGRGPLTATRASASSRRRSGIGRGVVVTISRGRAPSRKAELQHVPGLLDMAPFRELVAPGGLELRPAQRIRILGREHMRDGAVSPFELRSVGDQAGRSPGSWMREQARRALDHDVARVSEGLADERDAAAPARRRQPAEAGARAPITHSAPARVLPAPRPPSTSQVVHGPPLLAQAGGS